MKILFVHQNIPGQYRELIGFLVTQGTHELTFLTQREDMKLKGVDVRVYQTIHRSDKDSFSLTRTFEDGMANGYSVAQAIKQLQETEGFAPDIVIGHTGWGELTFIKDVLPDVPIIGFIEYFYRATGGMVGIDPEGT